MNLSIDESKLSDEDKNNPTIQLLLEIIRQQAELIEQLKDEILTAGLQVSSYINVDVTGKTGKRLSAGWGKLEELGGLLDHVPFLHAAHHHDGAGGVGGHMLGDRAYGKGSGTFMGPTAQNDEVRFFRFLICDNLFRRRRAGAHPHFGFYALGKGRLLIGARRPSRLLDEFFASLFFFKGIACVAAVFGDDDDVHLGVLLFGGFNRLDQDELRVVG